MTNIKTQTEKNTYAIRLKVANTEIINVYKPPAQPLKMKLSKTSGVVLGDSAVIRRNGAIEIHTMIDLTCRSGP